MWKNIEEVNKSLENLHQGFKQIPQQLVVG